MTLQKNLQFKLKRQINKFQLFGPVTLFLTVWYWLLCCCTSVKTTGPWSAFVYVKENYRALCFACVKASGRGRDWSAMCISIQVQHLSHHKSSLNLVIIAWWASLLFSTLMPRLPPDLATSPSHNNRTFHSSGSRHKTSELNTRYNNVLSPFGVTQIV